MRARRREINIFNMSLLDILCGALGAFCFMTIVALPYYKPPGKEKDLREAQAETQKLLGDLEKMKDRMSDPKSVAEMEELIRRLEAQVKALQGQLNILAAEKEELQRRVDQLTAENGQLQGRVNQLTADNELLKKAVAQLTGEKEQLQAANQQVAKKNQEITAAHAELIKQFKLTRTFTVACRADSLSQDIQILFTHHTEAQESSVGFSAWLRGSYDPGNQFRDFLSSRGAAMKTTFVGSPGNHYVIYVKSTADPNRREATTIDSALVSGFDDDHATRLAKVTLSPERPWMLLGTITIDDNYDPIFKEATSAERDAEWQAVTHRTPTPTPTPPSAESLKAAAEARAKNKMVRDKFARLIRIRPSDSGENDAEILSLADELIKALPPGDTMRREAESARERTLELKRRRERGPALPTSPNDATPPPPPPRPRSSATPTFSPTP